MDPTRPNYSKILSPDQAAQKLGVSIDTLYLWSNHNILTPLSNPDGSIGYSQDQIAYFQSIRRSIPNIPTQDILPEKEEKKAAKNHFSGLFISVFLVLLIGLAFILTKDSKSLEKSTLDVGLSENNPVSLENQKSQDRQLHNPAPNTSFSYLSQPKTEKPKVSSLSAKVIEKRVLGTAAQIGKNSEMATIAAYLKANDASSISPDTTSSGFSLNLGNLSMLNALNTTNNIKNTTLTAIASFGVFAFMLLLYQSQLSFAGVKPKKTNQSPHPYTLDEEKIIRLEQKVDGTVIAIFQGKEYKICKPELYSDSDQFIERLMQLTTDGKEIEYDNFTDATLKFSTPLSRIVTRLNFVGLKRDLFFPRTSKSRVFFRRYVTYQDLMTMNLTISNVIGDLTKID